MCGCKYLSLLPTEELLEVTELYFSSNIIIYAQKKERTGGTVLGISATFQHRQLNSSVGFYIPHLETDTGHSMSLQTAGPLN